MANKWRKAKHNPNEVWWRFVDERKMTKTDHGPIVLYPDEHIELHDPETGVEWGNSIEDWIRRYGKSLTGKDRKEFEERYPGLLDKYG